MLECTDRTVRHIIQLRDAVDLISEKFHTDDRITLLCRIDLQHIPTHAEAAAVQIQIVTVVLDADQFPDHIVPILLLARAQRYDQSRIFIRAAQTIDTGYAGDDHHIPPLGQRRCRRQSQLIDLVINIRVFFNIGIRRRHIRLRLVIIVIGYKIFDRILREEFFELTIELGR